MKRTLMNKGLAVLLAAAAGMAQAAQAEGDRVVANLANAIADTESGKVQGFVRGGIVSFRGIPYAASERFGLPQKVPAWAGIKSALSYGPICPIAPMTAVANDEFFNPHRYWPQNEACQNLNIWTPGIRDGKRRPVMVWFHGGGHSNGSAIEGAAYDGENLARKGDVVVVTVNHRLNVIGYLDLSAYGGKYKDAVNLGSKDLVAALQWVRANISEFGGDPGNVTIFGQSGGGSKVLTMMGAPSAKGLFQKGIMESGGTGAFLEQKATRRVAELTLANLGIAPAQIDQIKSVPYLQLLEAATKAVADAGKELGTSASWGPVIDGAFLPAQPGPGTKGDFTPLAKEVPVMIGTAFAEQNTVTGGVDPMKLELDDLSLWDAARVKSELAKKFGDKADAVSAAFAKAYPDKLLAQAIYVDSRSRPNAIKAAALKARQGAPVYNYLFSWESPSMNGIAMSYHCSEIPFVFYNTQLADTATGGGPRALALSERVSQAWINFARFGDPNNSALPSWKPYDPVNGGTMILDDNCEFKYGYDKELMAILAP
jgi:para-nitrobenzyl esterase